MTTDDPGQRRTAQNGVQDGAQDNVPDDAHAPRTQGASGAQDAESERAKTEDAPAAPDRPHADAPVADDGLHADASPAGDGLRDEASVADGGRPDDGSPAGDGLHDDAPAAHGRLHDDAPAAHDAPLHDPVTDAAELTAPATPASPDRVYRSGGGIAGGVLLLALVAWLGVDALLRGQGHTPWLALATMLLLVPLVLAFTIRPAVFANDERLRVRNPLRTITLPWAAVAGLRSGYSNEVLDRAGVKYQLWAIPVSLRARKKASRAELRARSAASRPSGGLFGGTRSRTLPGAFGGSPDHGGAASGDLQPRRATPDRSMDDLRELAETQAEVPAAQGEPEVRWCYEVLAPAAAGLVLLAVLLGVG